MGSPFVRVQHLHHVCHVWSMLCQAIICMPIFRCRLDVVSSAMQYGIKASNATSVRQQQAHVAPDFPDQLHLTEHRPADVATCTGWHIQYIKCIALYLCQLSMRRLHPHAVLKCPALPAHASYVCVLSEQCCTLTFCDCSNTVWPRLHDAAVAPLVLRGCTVFNGHFITCVAAAASSVAACAMWQLAYAASHRRAARAPCVCLQTCRCVWASYGTMMLYQDTAAYDIVWHRQ
jgi:hypothetical protein